ncbi:MAG: hypothetical protein MUF45_02960 [Spirosomaceae bacterium]|jgi:hypothetical protein|nr:hypothetical protein [Spirosomataceae bacterium]
MNKYSQLSHAHFEHRLWKNELEMIAQETDFFLSVVEDMPLGVPNLEKEYFINQFHHFQRLIKRLLQELATLQKTVAEGVLDENILDSEQKLDHKYMREEMDYFEQDYKAVKKKFRGFIAARQEIFT